MAENVEKEYYKDILELVEQKSQDAFYKEMLNAIKGGKLEVYQKRSRQQLTFDSTWIEVIKNNLTYVEAIVRNPRNFMEAIEDVAPIQRAKKINSRSVQHLSSHVQNVQEIRDDGTIVPSKILSTTYEDTIIIYENRFVMTLINKLAAFIELRYNSILDSVKSYQKDHLNAKSTFKWRNYDIEATIDLSVKNEINDEISKKNVELLEDIETIRNYIRGFMNSQFYIELKRNSKPVVPPILKTNIIQGSVNYNSCLKLWQFLDSYRQLGIDLDLMDKDLTFDNAFIQDVCDMFILNYSLISCNQMERSETYELLPYKYKKEKAPINVRNLIAGDHDKLEGKDLEDPTISEYFYNRSKKKYKQEFTKDVNAGISYNKSFVTVYRRMQKIENGIQKEIIESLEEKLPPETTPYEEQRQARYLYLKRVRSMYKTIIYLKKQDLMKMEEKLKKAERDLARFEEEDKKYREELKAKREEQLRLYRLQKRLENGEVIPEEELNEATSGQEVPVNDVVSPSEEVKETVTTEETAPTEEAAPQANKYAYLRNARRGKAGKESKVPSFKELNKDNNVEEETLTPSSPINEEPTTTEEVPQEDKSIDKYAYLRNLSKGRKGGKENKVPSFKELQSLNEENKLKLEEETPVEEVVTPTSQEPIVSNEVTDVTPSEESSTNDKLNLLHKARRNKGKETRVPSFKELEAMKQKESEEAPSNEEITPVSEEIPQVEEQVPTVEEVTPVTEEITPTNEDVPQTEEDSSSEVPTNEVDSSYEEPTRGVESTPSEDHEEEKDEEVTNAQEESNEHIPSFKEINERNEKVLPTYNSETKTIPNVDASTRKNARFAFLRKASSGRQGKETKVPSFKDLNK